MLRNTHFEDAGPTAYPVKPAEYQAIITSHNNHL